MLSRSNAALRAGYSARAHVQLAGRALARRVSLDVLLEQFFQVALERCLETVVHEEIVRILSFINFVHYQAANRRQRFRRGTGEIMFHHTEQFELPVLERTPLDASADGRDGWVTYYVTKAFEHCEMNRTRRTCEIIFKQLSEALFARPDRGVSKCAIV